VIDEIQRLPQLLNEVHRFIESRRFEFALSGSSARKLRKAGTNLLAGRAVQRTLHALVPEELGAAFDLDRVLASGSIALVWDRGGGRDVLEAYVQTYLKEEIQAEALVRNLPGFARFLPVAALFHAQVLNAASLARDAGVSRTTVLGYLDVLEDTLLAFRLSAYEGRLRVKEKRHPKLYWIDPGIARAARRRFGPTVSEERGPLFEGWVASLLRAYRAYRGTFDEWNYWAPTEAASLEVDFLLWRDDECVALEAKAGRRFRPEWAKGLDAFTAAYRGTRAPRRMVVYRGEERLATASGVEVLPLRAFLDELEGDRLFRR
jgi:predicted AAA+ superfamily ATPase